jgi:predicted ATPase
VAERQILQAAYDLPSDAQNLAQFLQTLHGRDRDTFEIIERFVITTFPEFRHVNAVSGPNNQLWIDLTEALTNRRIPLSNCGTGVEQILTLATFVLTTPKPGIILMDEPHSYLHPTAERSLVQFLHEHSEHKYLISTHSAVLMNAVEPDRIIYVSPPGQPYKPAQENAEVSKILFEFLVSRSAHYCGGKK